MKTKKTKKIIIGLLISLMIILFLIILIIFRITNENNKENPTEINKEYDGSSISEQTPLTETKEELSISSYEYMWVRNSIQKYINTIDFSNIEYYIYNDEDGYIMETTEDEISKKAYDLLSTEFIKKNNVKDVEVFKYINKIESSKLITIAEMKKIRSDESIKSIAVNVVLQEAGSLKADQIFYIIVNIDDKNETYSVEPLNAKSMDEVKASNEIKEIQPNGNNKFEYTSVTEKDIIKECIDRYKGLAVISPEFVYNNILDKEYREKRFGNAENFKNYIQKNKEEIKIINIKKYQAGVYDSKNQYVCVDQDGKYYIFRESDIIDCTLLLDTYSIDIPEFIEKYDSASETNKVGLNANKIVEAVNNKDYEYIYNKLNETFRNSNFEDIDIFEDFINNTFYTNNVMRNAQCKQEGNAYVFTMQISNQEETEKLKDVVLIMQLLDNRNYVISFAK